jgi:hypothetical protein
MNVIISTVFVLIPPQSFTKAATSTHNIVITRPIGHIIHFIARPSNLTKGIKTGKAKETDVAANMNKDNHQAISVIVLINSGFSAAHFQKPSIIGFSFSVKSEITGASTHQKTSAKSQASLAACFIFQASVNASASFTPPKFHANTSAKTVALSISLPVSSIFDCACVKLIHTFDNALGYQFNALPSKFAVLCASL